VHWWCKIISQYCYISVELYPLALDLGVDGSKLSPLDLEADSSAPCSRAHQNYKNCSQKATLDLLLTVSVLHLKSFTQG